MKEESIVGSLLEVAHSHISAIVERGEVVMDATLGNGHDTLFLAQCVGARGRVIGFDVQQAAIDATRERLVSSGVPEAVYQLHLMSHSRAGDVINEPCAAVMFNLGYLPGAEKSTITQTKTTLEAIRAGLALLRDGGILTVMCYPGHSGGDEEAAAVLEWAQGQGAGATVYRRENSRETTPFLISLTK